MGMGSYAICAGCQNEKRTKKIRGAVVIDKHNRWSASKKAMEPCPGALMAPFTRVGKVKFTG